MIGGRRVAGRHGAHAARAIRACLLRAQHRMLLQLRTPAAGAFCARRMPPASTFCLCAVRAARRHFTRSTCLLFSRCTRVHMAAARRLNINTYQ